MQRQICRRSVESGIIERVTRLLGQIDGKVLIFKNHMRLQWAKNVIKKKVESLASKC